MSRFRRLRTFICLWKSYERPDRRSPSGRRARRMIRCPTRWCTRSEERRAFLSRRPIVGLRAGAPLSRQRGPRGFTSLCASATVCGCQRGLCWSSFRPGASSRWLPPARLARARKSPTPDDEGSYGASHDSARSRRGQRWSSPFERPRSNSSCSTYDERVAQVVKHTERFGDTFRDLPAPTEDDVTILRDGRRLDSAAKVRAFVAELRRDQARRAAPTAGRGELER